jgi:uncharacterized protein
MYYSYSTKDQTAIIQLKVKAGAKHNIISGFVKVNDIAILKLSITEAPENGKANEAIIRFLSKSWNLKQNQLELIKGKTSSTKLLRILNIPEELCKTLMSNYQVTLAKP